MNLRTATPPLVAQRLAACCSGGHVHPQMILLFVVLKVCFFLQTVGSVFLRRRHRWWSGRVEPLHRASLSRISISGFREARYSCTHPLVFRRPRTTKPDRSVTNSAETMRRIFRSATAKIVHESARELIAWPKTVRNWRKLHRSRHSPGYHIPMTEYLAARRV